MKCFILCCFSKLHFLDTILCNMEFSRMVSSMFDRVLLRRGTRKLIYIDVKLMYWD